MEYHGPLLRCIAFALGSVLLWLGSEIGSAKRRGHGALAVAVVLVAAALWWPEHLMVASAKAAPGPDMAAGLALLMALTLAGCARLAAGFASRDTLLPFMAATLATLGAAYAHSTLATNNFFRVSGLAGQGVAGLAVVALAALLIAIQVSSKTTRRAPALRAFGAPVIALMLAFGAEMPLLQQAAGMARWPEVLLMAMLALASGVMLAGLGKSAPRAVPAVRRGAPTAPAIDALTQLPTRIHFESRLTAEMEKCDGGDGRLALLFIDLDGFKPVNDTYGHSIGDAVLHQVGERLKAMSRGRDIVARVGGDEFLLLLPRVGSDASVATVAKRLIEGLSQSYSVEHREVGISCSIGIAFYPDNCSMAKLIARADAAMYEAKRSGGSTHCFYAPEMEVDAADSFDLLRDLRKAVANNELELFYQPKVDAKSGKVTAAEALLRWNHPTRGQILPSVFIPLAERSGLIVALGNWVIEDACRQGRVWRDAGLRMRVAINLSPQQMRREAIVAEIAGALERHRIHPSLLTCEITESVAMEDTKATQETFRRLGELGAHLSIDDFGTGYSSLSYLRQLPAEELKIDRSFIMDLDHSADARAVVDAVVRLAHALGLKVVAEGVENQRQQQILAELGCDELQGYLFAKPMSARALLLWAMSDRTSAAMAFNPSLFGETKQVQRVE